MPPLRRTLGWQLVPAVPRQLRVTGVWPRGHSCRRVPAVPAVPGDTPSPSIPETRSPAPVHRWSSCCEFPPSLAHCHIWAASGPGRVGVGCPVEWGVPEGQGCGGPGGSPGAAG